MKYLKIFENFGIEDFYQKNNINIDTMSYLGKGDFGIAYSIGNGKVLKITSSYSEYEIAKDLISKNYEGFVKFFDTAEIGHKFYIICEEVDNDSSIEDLYYELSYILAEQNLSMQELYYFDEDQYEEGNKISREMRVFMLGIAEINRCYRMIGIEASDVKPENMAMIRMVF